MKTILSFKSAIMLAICLIVLLVSWCSIDEERTKAAEVKNINNCEKMGGLPVRSLWDDRLVDCIFKPKQGN